MNKKWILLLILFILGFFIRIAKEKHLIHWLDETVYLQMSEVIFSDV
ncbi:MAG TPA: hypothetical protein VJB89_01565 [Candidatus Nanoarchaeia archaeon]|nr:hypothetical protein [Candidatus Nanoarchaeia archaeon]